MILTTHSAFSIPALIVLFALLVDMLVGDPKWLYKVVPHPIVIFGNPVPVDAIGMMAGPIGTGHHTHCG